MNRIVTILVLMMLALIASAQRCEHRVQRGEDFETIAQKYGITVEELMAANPDSKECYAGRKLQIPWHGVPVQQKDPEVKPFDYGLTSSAGKVLTKSAVAAYQTGQALYNAKKYDEAYAYLAAAADSGEVRACYTLGEFYLNKETNKFNEGLAIQSFKKACEGVTDKAHEAYWHSCGYLAEYYLNGTVVGKDLNAAKQYAQEYANYSIGKSKDHAVKVLGKINGELEQIARAERERQAAERRQMQAEQRQMASNNKPSGGQPKRNGKLVMHGTDPVNHSLDGKIHSSYKNEWTRPAKGQMLTGDTYIYMLTKDHSRGINIKVYNDTRINRTMATIHEDRYAQYSVEYMVLTGEADDMWVFSNCTFSGMFSGNQLVMRTGYTLFLAKDWSWAMVSPYTNDVYTEMISGRRYAEMEATNSITHTNDLSPHQKSMAQTRMIINQLNANLEATRARNEMKHAAQEARHRVHHGSSSSSSSSSSSRVDIKQYGPDYNGGDFTYWCDKCQNYGPNHYHKSF